ncbi:hypothetical protein MHYP_G00303020 [Metynnis hypsauchen]
MKPDLPVQPYKTQILLNVSVTECLRLRPCGSLTRLQAFLQLWGAIPASPPWLESLLLGTALSGRPAEGSRADTVEEMSEMLCMICLYDLSSKPGLAAEEHQTHLLTQPPGADH